MVGGDGHGHAMGAQCLHGRQLGFAQKVIGAGQQHRHRAGGLHGAYAVNAQVLQVVAREGAELGCQRCAALVAELLGVQLDGQAQGARRLKHAPRLSGGEAYGLAKCVYCVHQPLCMKLGHPGAHGVDIVVAAACIFGGYGVGAEVGGAHAQGQALAQGARHAKAACLVLKTQAVAGLDLDGGHALCHQAAGAAGGAVEQGGFAGGTGGSHAGAYAAACLRNLLVAGALQAHFELSCAVATVYEVGVAVHQAGGDQGTIQIYLLRDALPVLSRQVRARAAPDDVFPRVSMAPSSSHPQGSLPCRLAMRAWCQSVVAVWVRLMVWLPQVCAG